VRENQERTNEMNRLQDVENWDWYDTPIGVSGEGAPSVQPIAAGTRPSWFRFALPVCAACVLIILSPMSAGHQGRIGAADILSPYSPAGLMAEGMHLRQQEAGGITANPTYTDAAVDSRRKTAGSQKITASHNPNPNLEIEVKMRDEKLEASSPTGSAVSGEFEDIDENGSR
jgi:hypothetical protein